ncbi:MAG: hypothetical protein KGD63_15760 [Candidatus Lokiarchaeota archaeon]|nr:hypothetical protein [Candidatus Lokiarchaeota archaeon]
MSQNKGNNDKRDQLVHIVFTKKEKDLIKKLADSSFSNISEFIRQSVFERINRIKNPEEFYPVNSSTSINSDVINKILENTNQIYKKQDLLIENTRILDKMSDILAKIQKYSKPEELEKKTLIILALFEKHNSLSQKEIIEETGFDESIIFQVISNNKLFRKLELKNPIYILKYIAYLFEK